MTKLTVNNGSGDVARQHQTITLNNVDSTLLASLPVRFNRKRKRLVGKISLKIHFFKIVPLLLGDNALKVKEKHKNTSWKSNDSYKLKMYVSRYIHFTDIKDFHILYRCIVDIDSWVVVIFKAQTLRVPMPQHNLHWTHHHNKWWCLSQVPVDIRNGDKHVPLHCLCHQQIQTHGSQSGRRPLSISQRLDYLSRPFCHIQKASHHYWKPSQSHGDKGLKGLSGIERLVLLRYGAVVILSTHWPLEDVV